MALVDLVASWNTHAQAAGYISKEAARRISYWRGRLCSQLIGSPVRPPTAMAAVALETTQTEAAVERVNSTVKEGSLEVACVSSPESHTIGGHMAKIEALVDMLNEEGAFARKLVVDIAYHSSYLKPISEEHAKVMGEIEPGESEAPKTISFVSLAARCFVHLGEVLSPLSWMQSRIPAESASHPRASVMLKGAKWRSIQ